MINILISGRHPVGQTLDDFYHEFEVTHVNYMRQANCERFIRCYTQNKVIRPIPTIETLVDIDPNIDSQASLTFDDFKDIDAFFNDKGYNQYIKPHEFTDPNYMTFDLAEVKTIKPGKVNANFIKVIYYLKAQPHVPKEDFHQFIDRLYSKLTTSAQKELLSIHLRSYCIPLDPRQFVNSAFKNAKISQFGVIDELWFENLKNLQIFHQGLKEKIQHELKNIIDFENSFSLIVTDRVVFS